MSIGRTAILCLAALAACEAQQQGPQPEPQPLPAAGTRGDEKREQGTQQPETTQEPKTATNANGGGKGGQDGKEPAVVGQTVEKALDWLAGAQQKDGGFGGGSHAHQAERNAHGVPTDPATTAVAAIALLRAGNGLEQGAYAATLRRATEYLLAVVEKSKEEGPQITELTGTQPQAKMGANVDTALTAQYLARLMHALPKDHAERPRVVKALDKCLHKIETSQAKDGSWTAGGWAPVLQSSQMCTALELAQIAGVKVAADKLERARSYQKGQAGPAAGTPGGSGRGDSPASSVGFRTDAAAGVVLYAQASNLRAVAAESKAAEELVEVARREGRIEKDAKVDEKTLRDLGQSEAEAKNLAGSFAMNTAAKAKAFDENVLAGFGNNGGEEFLSYQMTSEALAIDGGEDFAKWRTTIAERLAKVQNPNGSWTGHHCITSPVFCTATAISALTADRDVEWLRRASTLAKQ